MPRNTGLIQFEGEMGNIIGFKKNGEYFVKQGGSVSKDDILTKPNFARTRENMSKFRGAAFTARDLHNTFKDLNPIYDNQLYQRLFAKSKKVNLLDLINLRGQRNFDFTTASARAFYQNLNLNRLQTFSTVFTPPFTQAFNAPRTASTITIPTFDASNTIILPSGASHFRLFSKISSLSNYTYDSTTELYLPTNPTQTALTGTTYSAITPLSNTAVTFPILSATIVGPIAFTTTVFGSIGIIFYQQDGPNFFRFYQKDAAKIIIAG